MTEEKYSKPEARCQAGFFMCGGTMPDPKQPDVWALLFEQTPRALQWALGIVTFGIFTLAGVLYRWHRADLQRIESRIDHMESRLDTHMQEQNKWLAQIAANTTRGEL